jgi:hypothetical protein
VEHEAGSGMAVYYVTTHCWRTKPKPMASRMRSRTAKTMIIGMEIVKAEQEAGTPRLGKVFCFQ